MTNLEIANNMAPNLSTLCNSIVLVIAFGSGFAIYLQYLTPSFSYMNPSILLGWIMPLLEKYVDHVTDILNQAVQQLPLESISDLPMGNVVVALQYLAPFIEMFELLFNLLKHLVEFLERIDSPLLGTVEGMWEDLRDIGNPIMELYRALERTAGITPEQSRFAEAWFEN